MMHSAKGSISLPCLLAALLLALSAQLCLLYAVKGYEAERIFTGAAAAAVVRLRIAGYRSKTAACGYAALL